MVTSEDQQEGRHIPVGPASRKHESVTRGKSTQGETIAKKDEISTSIVSEATAVLPDNDVSQNALQGGDMVSKSSGTVTTSGSNLESELSHKFEEQGDKDKKAELVIASESDLQPATGFLSHPDEASNILPTELQFNSSDGAKVVTSTSSVDKAFKPTGNRHTEDSSVQDNYDSTTSISPPSSKESSTGKLSSQGKAPLKISTEVKSVSSIKSPTVNVIPPTIENSQSQKSQFAGNQWTQYLKRAVANVEQTLDKVISETATSEVGGTSEGSSDMSETIVSKPPVSEVKMQASLPVKTAPKQTTGRLTMQERLAMALAGRTASASSTSPTGARTDSSVLESPISSNASLDSKRASVDMISSPENTANVQVQEKHTSVASKTQETNIDILKSLVASLPESEVKMKLEEQVFNLTATSLTIKDSELLDAQEKINSLESKLKFFARDEGQRAKIDKDSKSGLERKLAEKEEQVALLLEEGQALSRNELKHMNTIKVLRAKERDFDRILKDSQRRQETAERETLHAKELLKTSQDFEKRYNEGAKARARAENENEILKKEKQFNMVRHFFSFSQLASTNSAGKNVGSRK